MGFAVLEIGIQQTVDILQCCFEALQFHAADSPPQQQRYVSLFAVEGSSIVVPGLFVLLHESEAVALADEGDLFVGIETDGFVEVSHGLPVVLEFEMEFAAVDVSLIVLGIVFDAEVELDSRKITIYYV